MCGEGLGALAGISREGKAMRTLVISHLQLGEVVAKHPVVRVVAIVVGGASLLS
jgi:hypothetical protein